MKKIYCLCLCLCLSALYLPPAASAAEPQKVSVLVPSSAEELPPPTPEVIRVQPEQLFSSGPAATVYRSRMEVLRLAGVVALNGKRSLEAAADIAPLAGEAVLAVKCRRLAGEIRSLVRHEGPIAEQRQATWCRETAALMEKKARSATGERKGALLEFSRMLRKSSAFYTELQMLRAVECKERNLLCRFFLVPHCVDPCDVTASELLAVATCERTAQMVPEWMPVFGAPFPRWSPALAAQLGGVDDLDAYAATTWLVLMKPYFEEAHGLEWTEEIYSSNLRRTQLWLIGSRVARCGSEQFYGAKQKLTEHELKRLLEESGSDLLENQKALEVHMVRTLPNCNPCQTDSGLASVSLEVTGISFSKLPPEEEVEIPCCGQ